MNKELSSLNHNEPVFIYRWEGGGGGGKGKGKGGSLEYSRTLWEGSVNFILSFSCIKTFLSY